MATGSGTGTPIAAGSLINTLRDRIRTQLESASGFTAPLAVSASAETLTTLRDRVGANGQGCGKPAGLPATSTRP